MFRENVDNGVSLSKTMHGALTLRIDQYRGHHPNRGVARALNGNDTSRHKAMEARDHMDSVSAPLGKKPIPFSFA